MRSRAVKLLLCLPYAAAGVLAPILFSRYSNPHDAGRIAGLAFILTGLYGLWLCGYWRMNPYFRGVFRLIVACEVFFWGWRFFAETPLRDFNMAGVTGGMLHGFASGLYLVGGMILVVGALKRA